MKKIVYLIIFVFIVSSLCASDLYVGSGEEFQEIGAAIQAAENGDNIYVYEGYYQENLYIDKNLQINGIDQPVLSGGTVNSFQYWAVKITGNITAGFAGFIIENSRWGGIRIISGANAEICNNLITTENGSIDRPIEINGAGEVYIHDNYLNGTTYNFIEIQPVGSQSITIHNNVFVNMGYSQLRNQQDESIDCRYNYWGSEHGPSHFTNPTGQGFSISGNIEYFPWYRSEDLTQLILTGDVIAGALEVNLSDEVFIDAQDTQLFNNYYDLPADADFKDVVYGFNIEENFAHLVDISIENSDFEVQIALYGNPYIPGADNALFHNINAGECGLYDLDLPTGFYYLIVDGLGADAAGNYQIEFSLSAEIIPICEYSEISAEFQETSHHICLTWTTEMENDNLGWNIYRSDINNWQTGQLINDDLIPGSGSSVIPINYEFTDDLDIIEFCTYYYWLESNNSEGEIDLSSVTQIQIPQFSDSGFFDFKECLLGDPSSINLIITELNDDGNIQVNGGVTGNPYLLEWDWGDGETSAGFFPQFHIYESTSQNYIIEVTANYNNGYNNNQPSTGRTLVRFIDVSEEDFIELPEITAVSIPDEMVPLATVPGFGLPAGLTWFDDSFFTVYNRSVIEYVLSVCADIEMDFAGGNVFLTAGAFNQVLLRNPNAGGMSSLWFTRPVSFQSGDYGIGSSIQWSSFFHEMGHNVTLNMPAEYFYGGKSDGPANCIFSETMAQIYQHASAYEILNSRLGEDNEYGIPADLALEIECSATSAIGVMRNFYQQYISEGMNFCSWNDTSTPEDETLPTFMTLAYRFCLHAEANIEEVYTEAGYRIPLQRMSALLQLWDAELHALWNQWQDDPQADIFRSTLMITAMSYGFNQDLRSEFISLNFPIDDVMYEELLNRMENHLWGDIDQNGIVEAYDASLILMYFAGLNPEPLAPLPWENWQLFYADVDGNSCIEAYDAALVLRYYLGMINSFPAE